MFVGLEAYVISDPCEGVVEDTDKHVDQDIGADDDIDDEEDGPHIGAGLIHSVKVKPAQHHLDTCL